MSVNVGKAVGYLDLDTSKFKAGLKDALSTLREFTNQSNSAGTRFEALGSSLKIVGRTITTAVSLPLLALGAGAIKVAGDFEAGMSEVSAITGATGKDIEALEQQARQLGATTKFSASDAAEGMKYFGMAGYKTDQIMSALPATLNLAAAGGTDLGIACDIVSDAMTGLGMSAEQTGKFTDIMAAAITNSNTNIELMGETLKYVGPVAGTLGIEMGDLSVAIGLMGNAGIKGSQAGTALRSGLTNLVKPTDQMQAAMDRYGVELVKNADGSVNLMGTMENLRSTLGGLDQATQAQALATIFGKEAMSGFASIVNASEADFNKLSDAIANSEGKASEMAATMQDNLKGSIDNMKSAFEEVMIVIGERLIPIFQNLVDGITNVFTWFNNLNPAIQNVIIGVGGFLAILGPLLLIIGNIIIFITNLGTAIGTLVTFFSAGGAGAGILSAAIAAITGPIGLTIAAITALIAAGVLLISNWDEIKTFLLSCFEAIKNGLDSAFSWICNKLGADSNEIKSIISDTWNNVKDTVNNLIQQIKSIISDTWDIIKECIDESVGAIYDVIKETWEKIKQALTIAGEAIDQLIKGDWEGAKQTIKTAVDMIKTSIQDAWTKIKEIISNLGRDILEYIKFCWEDIKTAISTAITNIKTSVSNGWNNLKSATKTAFDNIKAIASTIWNGIKTDISNKVGEIKSSVSTKINSIKSTVSSVFSSLTNIMTAPFKTAQKVISGILGRITSAINKVTSGIKKVTSMFRMVEDPRQEDQEYLVSYADNDYSKTRFNYARAKQTTVSDVIATNYSMIEGLKDFAKGLKTDNKQANVNTENSISINLNIDKFVNERKQDVKELMQEMTFEIKRQRLGFGGVR